MVETLEMKLKDIFSKYDGFKEKLKREKMENELEYVKSELMKPEVYSNIDKSMNLSKMQAELESGLAKINEIELLFDDIVVLLDFMKDGDTSVDTEIQDLLKKLDKMVDKIYLETLYSEKFDESDALVVVHAGAGGEEAQDWTDMLTRMYQKYFSKVDYNFEIVDRIPGDGAGTKSITMIVSGKHAYGNMKCERGVHRLVRISPFDANKRRHTSFASVEVSPILEKNA